MPSVVGTRKTKYYSGNERRRQEALRKEALEREEKVKEKVDWGKAVAESLNVLVQFKKLFAKPEHKTARSLKAKCPRKGCGGTVYAYTSGPPKYHLRFYCTNVSTTNGGTGDCCIQGME